MPALAKYRDVNESSSSSENSDEIGLDHVSSTKLCLLFTCLVFLGILCLANSLILAVMYQVLDIGLSGMNSLEFSNGEQNTRWVLETDLEEILLPKNGGIDGFDDQNLDLAAERNQNISLTAKFISESKVSLTSSGSVFHTGFFKFVDEESGKTIIDFNDDKKKWVEGNFGDQYLATNGIETHGLSSPVNEDLELVARDGGIFLTGNQHVTFDAGRKIEISSYEDLSIAVKNSNNKLTIDGGLKLNRLRVPSSRDEDAHIEDERYRLCVCTKTGQLFRAKMVNDMMTCAIASENPCP
ncbi:beta-sarcoglycan-like [Clytia hemisphaerica]|uniref:Beta-sarcoglycan n=1 Tax=Clytia hemisphaerica TaxID=252671 RepID=A0A7M5VEE1_9CNID